jgi:tetratricopeptide (TPR) repeat protein
MSQTQLDPSPAVPRRGRRRVLAALLLGGVLLAGGAGLVCWFAWPVPSAPPPTLDLTHMDPAVARAVAEARDQVLKTPRSADAWGNLGMVLLGHQLLPEAADCFTQAERLADKEAQWPYLHAVAVQRTDPETAVAELRRALDRGGDEAGVARLRLAELLLEQGRFEEAESEFHEALKANPDDARALLGLARVENQRDDPAASLPHLERAATDPHARKAATLLMAEVHQRLGDGTAAERDLRAANALPPDAPWPDPLVQEASGAATGQLVLSAHANQLLMEDRVPEAVALLQKILHDYPESNRAWFLLGKGLMREDNLAGAETALREATRLAPAADEYQYDLGTVLFSRGQPAAAAECFRKATELKPDFARAYYNLGHCLKQLGDRDGAVTAFRNAVRSEPRLAAAHANLGELLAQEGRTDEALLHLRQAVEYEPGDAHARQLLEDLRKRLGKPAK